ncbi:Sensor protein QseC [Variovorax sp. PBL-H6]|uniref:ATP-binding protein n=1 Tax=Variovorax sp. PBL-H6 TaxID=434009 RepID=UPI0013178407|nr:ATP-binding protein [Variovorax sp. PBL-H6]VTU27985.1 Sensor protein QseC [Variovorax sp. PBL-H6]
MIRATYSLQGRLAWLLLGLLMVAWTGTAAITWFDARRKVEEILDSHLAQAATLLIAQHREPAHGFPVDAPALHRDAYRTAIQVFHDERLVLRSANAPLAPLAQTRIGSAPGFSTVRLEGRDWRVFSVQDPKAGLQVHVGEEEESRDAILWAVLRSTLWPLFGALPLLVLAVWWAVHRGLRPMRHLGRALLERRPDVLDRMQVDDAPSEMAPMIDALNAMFRRIEFLLESERRFTADAAHELRTPIAAIRAHAQVAMHEADVARRSRSLQGTIDGCDRATRLVEQLLTLARLEADAMPEQGDVDLGALARRVLADIAPRAIAKHQSLELNNGPACIVRGDETLLTVLVRNLVDNAVRYSPPSARITVRVACGASGVRLSVEDGGPGLADADMWRLGGRFFRALGNSESGSGLGLSIARRIAAVHRMAIDIGRSPQLGGLAVHVRCPPSSPQKT